jgi:hypothetical protein
MNERQKTKERQCEGRKRVDCVWGAWGPDGEDLIMGAEATPAASPPYLQFMQNQTSHG